MSAVIEENSSYIKRDNCDEYSTRLWILIEYHTIIGNNKTPSKCYEVVDAKDVCGAGGRGNSTLEMTTGKLIYVKREKMLIQATIVTISDDKSFLDTELQDLLELQKNEQNQQHPKKRKRTATPKTEATNQYQRWNNREAATSPAQSVIISNPNAQNYPPMTFDQQTQTDFKQTGNDFNPIDARLSKMLSNEENIIRSQQTISIENHELKQSVYDLKTEINDMKTMLNEILTKLDNFGDRQKIVNGIDTLANNSVLNFSHNTQNGTPKILNQTPRILNLSQQSLAPQQTTYYNTISIEPIDASNDSFSLSNNSRRSLSISNQSIYHSDINRSTTNLNQTPNEQHSISIKSDCINISRNSDNFTDDDGNNSDEIIIGNNQTSIKRSVLMNINWTSHTNATRKLLTAKFSRDVLATHSLTGKPSPAFMDSSKPTKNQLDAKIIADIVQFVAKRCNVTDTAVRSAITTKCADENKMMRQRAEKERKVLAAKVENKENVKNRN